MANEKKTDIIISGLLGSVVENFYHPYEAIFSDDVKRLHIKDLPANKYHYLFLKTCILKQKPKYQYGYKFNSERMCRQYIMLPVNKSNKLDFNYMEQYMYNIEHELINKYINIKQYNNNSLK